MTFLVHTPRHHAAATTGRFGLFTMVSLILFAKVGAVLLTGAPAVPGGFGRTSAHVVIARAGHRRDTGQWPLTPLGAVWSKAAEWFRNRATHGNDAEAGREVSDRPARAQKGDGQTGPSSGRRKT